MEIRLILGGPPLIRQAHAEDECVVVGWPPFPQTLRQVRCPSDDFGEIEVRAPDAVEFGVVHGLQWIDRGDVGGGHRFDPRSTLAAALVVRWHVLGRWVPARSGLRLADP